VIQRIIFLQRSVIPAASGGWKKLSHGSSNRIARPKENFSTPIDFSPKESALIRSLFLYWELCLFSLINLSTGALTCSAGFCFLRLPDCQKNFFFFSVLPEPIPQKVPNP